MGFCPFTTQSGIPLSVLLDDDQIAVAMQQAKMYTQIIIHSHRRGEAQSVFRPFYTRAVLADATSTANSLKVISVFMRIKYTTIEMDLLFTSFLLEAWKYIANTARRINIVDYHQGRLCY